MRQERSFRHLSRLTSVPNPLLMGMVLFWILAFVVNVPKVVAFAPSLGIHSTGQAVPLYSTTTDGVEVDPSAVLNRSVYDQIEGWIQQRSEARWRGDYETADAFRQKLNASDLLPPGLSLVIEDIPRVKGGGSRWSLVYDVSEQVSMDDKPTVLQLAHSALGLAVSSSQTHRDCSQELDRLVDQTMGRLNSWFDVHGRMLEGLSLVDCLDSHPEVVSYWLAVEQELRGRKAADAAFWFAIAGVAREELYELLLRVGIKELQRFGHRPSCRIKHLWAVVDRFAAAGVRANSSDICALSALLSSKDDHQVPSDEVTARWDLHADASSLLVWKFSTRQRKQRDFLTSAARHWQSQCYSTSDIQLKATTYDWKEIFKEPKRPLVIDIGCGMGLSLLGIASTANSDEEWHQWEHCNFLGVDLSPLAIRYGEGIARRWGYEGSLHFIVDTAERALKAVDSSYPGPVSQVLIQFPTPYRMVPSNTTSSDYQGNTQLPKNAKEGFMVTEELLQQAASLLEKSHGRLLLQSNCEDVAIHMCKTAIEAGMVGVQSKDPRLAMPVETTQRTNTWLSQQSESPNRAMGPIWWNSPILSKTCQTETEISCVLNNVPVHRCLLAVTETLSTKTL
eukprot:scaffold4201_cov178-Amphora_coffeaeformis.AAC.20